MVTCRQFFLRFAGMALSLCGISCSTGHTVADPAYASVSGSAQSSGRGRTRPEPRVPVPEVPTQAVKPEPRVYPMDSGEVVPEPTSHAPVFSSTPYGVDPIPPLPPEEVQPTIEAASADHRTKTGSYEPPAVETPVPPAMAEVTADQPTHGEAPADEAKLFQQKTPPAVAALEAEIEARIRDGNYADASALLERAIRIQPKNPELWHVLADVRLKQQQEGLAEDLAKKSNLLVKDAPALVRANWHIIAESRRLKGDSAGAAEALAKANE